MSEKHLTEQPWKTLVTKQGVKDIGLGKALLAYSNLVATNEHAKALDALKEVADLAIKLKKANATKPEIVAHLDDVVKEVKMVTPTLEAKAKSAAAVKPPAAAAAPPAAGAAKPAKEDSDEEKEAAALKKDLKQQMVSALMQVKSRAPGDPAQNREPKPQLQFMVFLAGKSNAVVVARKVGPATKKLLAEIAGVAGGGKFIQGECIFEKNCHTFVVEEVPGGLAKKLAAALFTETGQKWKVRVRSLDGSVTLDSDTDVDPDAAAPRPTAAVPPATTLPASGEDEMVKFKERLTGLFPQIKAMAHVKVAAGTKDEKGLNVLASEAGTLARSKDFAKAHKLLDLVELLIKKAGAPAPPANLLVIWREAKEAVDVQLEELYGKLKMTGLPVLGEVAGEIESVLAQYRTGLVAALTEYDQATGVKKENARAQAAKVVTAYQGYIPKDKHIIAADTNPFGVVVTIQQTLGVALAKLSKQLGAG